MAEAANDEPPTDSEEPAETAGEPAESAGEAAITRASNSNILGAKHYGQGMMLGRMDATNRLCL